MCTEPIAAQSSAIAWHLYLKRNIVRRISASGGLHLKNDQIADLDAYHSAIVRIAVVRDRSDSMQSEQLVFASVELVTAGRPVPDSMPVNTKGVPQVYRDKEAGLDLSFRRVAMRASNAVTWYRSLNQHPTLPIPRLDTDKGRYDGASIWTSALTDEPTWPSLSTPLADPSLFGSADDFYPTPFIGSGAHPARVHRQLAASNPLLERVIDDAGARAWLGRRIHFDIARHDELIGGAVLVVPDPDVRAVDTFMTRDADGHEHLVGEVLPRRGRSLNGLTLTLFEERFGAMHLFKSFTVDERLMIVPATDQLEHTGYALSHGKRGLVDQQKALPYIRTVGISIETVNRRLRLETQEGRRKDAPKVAHDVNEVTRFTNSIIDFEPDAAPPRDAALRFYASSERRHRQRVARKQELQWFDSREDALKFIRNRIGRARETVLIVDPYADGKDLFDFGHFITRRDITLRMLTSRLPFENEEMMRSGFEAALRSFAQRGVPAPEIKIMRGGKNPPIHDRFLVIDGDVWLSGNSLNAIGGRASVMLRLPDPSSVRERLEHLFDEAEPTKLDGTEQ